MRITTLAVFDSSGALIQWEGYEYAGPVAEAKKGRETVDQAGKNQLALGKQAGDIATQDQAIQGGYRKDADTAAGNLLTVPTNGGLNPALARQFEEEKRQIGRTYNDTAEAGIRGIAQRGMGVAPTGLEASLRNTAGRNADEAETSAYSDLLGKQLGLGVKGVERQDQQQQVYDPTRPIGAAVGANTGAVDAGKTRNKMGSKLGDIFSGIGQVASSVGAFV